MYREDKFVMSHRPYAVNLDSFRIETRQGWKGDYSICTLDAVWFNRKDRLTRACVGEVSGTLWGVPASVTEFLASGSDGDRDCFARWDGTSFWCAGQDPEENARHLELLRPMLAEFPAAPEGYSAWWRF